MVGQVDAGLDRDVEVVGHGEKGWAILAVAVGDDGVATGVVGVGRLVSEGFLVLAGGTPGEGILCAQEGKEKCFDGLSARRHFR